MNSQFFTGCPLEEFHTQPSYSDHPTAGTHQSTIQYPNAHPKVRAEALKAQHPASSKTSPQESPQKKATTSTTIIIIVSIVGGVLFLALLSIFFYKRRGSNNTFPRSLNKPLITYSSDPSEWRGNVAI